MARTKENIIVECKTHWVSIFIPGVLGLLFLIGTIGYLFSGHFSDAGILFLVVLVCGVVSFLRLNMQSLIMTETSISGRKGIIRTTKMVSPLARVQDIAVHNGLLGKILGYSTVTISTAGTGGTEYVFRYVKNADALQQHFVASVK